MLDLSTLRAAETMTLDIRHPTTGDLTGWVWTIAGPGHPATVAYQEKMQRRRLNEEKLKEQARINGRKWKGDDRDPDEVRRDNVEAVAVRVVDFTKVRLDGRDIAYSPDEVMTLLLDPSFGWLFGQVIEFLMDDAAFFSRSAASSATMLSTPSG